jgi:hypothetical protein
MNGHLWAGRLAVAVCCVMVVCSVVFALQWSAAPMPTAHATLASVAQPVQPPVPDALLRDDFSHDAVGSQPAGWTADDGRWDGVVQDGGHALLHGSTYGHVSAGSTDWAAYAVTARMRIPRLSTGFAGLAARYRDRGDYYACGVYYGSAVRLWRVRGGNVTLLDARRSEVSPEQFHDVRIVVSGNHISCEFDASITMSAVDNTFPTGKIAFLAATGEAAELTDVVVLTGQ